MYSRSCDFSKTADQIYCPKCRSSDLLATLTLSRLDKNSLRSGAGGIRRPPLNSAPFFRTEPNFSLLMTSPCANFQVFGLKNVFMNFFSLRFPGILTFHHFDVIMVAYLKFLDECEFRTPKYPSLPSLSLIKSLSSK